MEGGVWSFQDLALRESVVNGWMVSVKCYLCDFCRTSVTIHEHPSQQTYVAGAAASFLCSKTVCVRVNKSCLAKKDYSYIVTSVILK